jgi:site-specific DNA-methyltransferase (cytosine-N4-specific)
VTIHQATSARIKVNLMATLKKNIREALHQIDELMQAKTARDRADCLKIGETWYRIKDDPAIARGDLKKLAPDFNHHPDTLQRHMRLYAEQHLLADADSWAVTRGFVNDFAFEPYRSLNLLKAFKQSIRLNHSGNNITRLEPSEYDETGTSIRILTGDCRTLLHGLASESFNCCITSPPYFWARNYDHDDQIGQEQSVADYIFQLVLVFREAKRVLRKDGVCWIVIDDRWAGRSQTSGAKSWFNFDRTSHPADPEPRKSLIGIPDMLRMALRNDGWLIRSNIIWLRTMGNYEPVRDRPTHAYQSVIMLTKSARYWYDAKVREPSNNAPPNSQQMRRGRFTSSDRNITDVWAIAPETRVTHPAPFPVELAMNCVRRSCPPRGRILDPFAGSGTSGVVAKMLNMRCTLIELNEDYVRLAKERIAATPVSEASADTVSVPSARCSR